MNPIALDSLQRGPQFLCMQYPASRSRQQREVAIIIAIELGKHNISHAKTMLSMRKSVPRSSRQSDHMKT